MTVILVTLNGVKCSFSLLHEEEHLSRHRAGFDRFSLLDHDTTIRDRDTVKGED